MTSRDAGPYEIELGEVPVVCEGFGSAFEGTVVVDSIEPPPDGGYGWVIVGSCATLNAFTWGVTSSYGVFLASYLETSTFPGASSTDFALVGGLQFFMAMLMAPIVTIFTRHYGIHLPMLLGIIFQTLGYIFASLASKTYELYLTQGVLVGMGVGCIYLPAASVLPQWFEKNRSLANGITSAGTGIGGLIFSFSTQRMIDSMGISWSLKIIGVISGVLNFIAVILMRSRDKAIKPTQHIFDLKLFRRYDVLLLLGWLSVGMFGYVVILYSYSDFAHDQVGLSSRQAADMSGYLNLGTALGSPLTGWLSDRFGRIQTSGVVTFVCGVSVFAIWIPDNSYGLTIFYAIFVGAMLGVFWVTVAPLAVVVVGLVELSSMLSICWIVAAFPALFSEVIALKLRSGTRPYLRPQVLTGFTYVIAGLLLLELWRVNREKQKKSNASIR